MRTSLNVVCCTVPVVVVGLASSRKSPNFDGVIPGSGREVPIHESETFDRGCMPIDRERGMLECSSIEDLLRTKSVSAREEETEGGARTRTPLSPAAATIFRLSN